jgi:RHS repeat-associated protein
LNLRFPGQYFDVETGLVYNNRRTYDPTTGRFLKPNPFGFNGGIGLYVYGLNDPLMYIDPTGLAVPGAPPPVGPFPPEDPGRIPEASDIPSNIPGGPWTPAEGQPAGTFWGPKQPTGPRAECRWRPEGDDGTPPYWKTKAPGQKGWDRWNARTGNWQSPEESHPGNPPPVVEPPVIDPFIIP